MSFVRSASGTGRARNRRYECLRCIVVFTERDGDGAPDRARKLDRELVFTLQ
jgi:hypothetical protein